MRVLMIEADHSSIRTVIPFLKAGGAVVDHTETGEDAIEMVRHYDYDIVLLDLMLPDMEGYEVLRRLRSSRLDTPVLVMSSLTRPQAKVKAIW